MKWLEWFLFSVFLICQLIIWSYLFEIVTFLDLKSTNWLLYPCQRIKLFPQFYFYRVCHLKLALYISLIHESIRIFCFPLVHYARHKKDEQFMNMTRYLVNASMNWFSGVMWDWVILKGCDHLWVHLRFIWANWGL